METDWNTGMKPLRQMGRTVPRFNDNGAVLALVIDRQLSYSWKGFGKAQVTRLDWRILMVWVDWRLNTTGVDSQCNQRLYDRGVGPRRTHLEFACTAM